LLNELPATVYIGFGAIVAASITAIVSFVTLVTSKDQNISDHRQEWINSIREDISKFIGLVAHKSATLEWIEDLPIEKKKEQEAKLYSTIDPEICTLYNKIILRLNPIDDKVIIDDMKNIESFLGFKTEYAREDVHALEKLTASLRKNTHNMLRSEWKKVKSGEFSYRFTKWAFIVFIVFSLLYGTIKITEYTTKDMNTSNAEKSMDNMPNK
jgi:hypothetical protein